MSAPMVHELKTWPVYFQAVKSGEKPFEVRKDDRYYTVGDILHLREFEPSDRCYTGDELKRRITYKLSGPGFGIEEGFCVLGLAIDPPEESQP